MRPFLTFMIPLESGIVPSRIPIVFPKPNRPGEILRKSSYMNDHKGKGGTFGMACFEQI